eukprot:5942430-Pleurochrysis_carterae.AAC.1
MTPATRGPTVQGATGTPPSTLMAAVKAAEEAAVEAVEAAREAREARERAGPAAAAPVGPLTPLADCLCQPPPPEYHIGWPETPPVLLDLELVQRAKNLNDDDAGGRRGRKVRRGKSKGKSKKKVSEEEEMANSQAATNNAASLVHVARTKLCTWFIQKLGRFAHAQRAASSCHWAWLEYKGAV